MQLGQTQYYVTYVNGSPVYTTLPWGGNAPYGYQNIGKDVYVQGLQQQQKAAQDFYNTYTPTHMNGGTFWKDKNGNTYIGNGFQSPDTYQSQIDAVQNNQGINDPNYRDPSFSKFNPNGQPTEANYTDAEKARVANIPSNLGGTGAAVPAPNLGGASSATSTGASGSVTKPFGIQNINKTLNFGSQGTDVKELQNYLAGMGAIGADGKPLKADGIYGHDTQAAVMKFQQDHGLTQDGIFGPKSLAIANNVTSTDTQYGTGGGTNSNNSSGTSPTITTPPISSSDTGSGNTITYNGQTYTTASASDAALVRAVLAGIDNITTNSGMKINPDLNLGPDIIAKILEKAKATVHPQYAQQIAGIQQDLQRNVGNTVDAYGRDIASKQTSFQNNLGTARENYADSGLAFSGARAKGELGMQDTQNRDLASLSSQYGNTLGDYARNAEKSLGTAGYNAGFQLPNVNNYSASLSGNGGFDNSGNVNTGYTPGTYQLGTVPQSEAAAALVLRNQNADQASANKTAGLSYADLYS